MATTTNFGWETPDDTDLVKDGALAMRTLGNAIDASLVDLKGGTTGQVLSKNSNTDMDFTWVTSDDANAIQNDIVDAKGDLIAATAADTPSRLAVGNNGETLLADSAASQGLRWGDNLGYAAGKNRIINGAMLIDQRNAGAAVTVNSSLFYGVDRWRYAGQSTDGVYTAQQDNDAPSGFAKSLKITTTTADASIGAIQVYSIQQYIEGFNVADFGWGAAGAKTVTVSFWVRSSLTGTFGGSVRSSDAGRSYPFSYSITSANTWEKKSVTIVGDTTGTWYKNSDVGFNLTLSLGAGADRLGTSGAWASANYVGVTGQTNVIGTLNATWYITGVQVEIGSVATSFANAGGTIAGELAACQRYYWRGGGDSVNQNFGIGISTSTTNAYIQVNLPVQMRIAPSAIEYSTLEISDRYAVGVNPSAITIGNNAKQIIGLDCTISGSTQGRTQFLKAGNSTSAYLAFTAEL